MKSSISDINKEFTEINEKIKNIYNDISSDEREYRKSKITNSLWEKIFPGILLIKNTEKIKDQLNELLEITSNLKSETFMEEPCIKNEDDETETSSNFRGYDDTYLSETKDNDNLNVTDGEILDNNELESKGDKVEINPEKNNENMSPEPLALDIIKLRDQLLVAKYSSDEKTLKFINSLYKETGRILNTYGIESLEEVGAFNSQYHTIVDTKETDNLELKDKIAESYRPGYRMNGKVIRSQEVVLYAYAEKDTEEESDNNIK